MERRIDECERCQGRRLRAAAGETAKGWMENSPLPLLSGNQRTFFKKRYVGQQDGWQVKVFVTEMGDLSSDLGSRIVERENQFPQVVPRPPQWSACREHAWRPGFHPQHWLKRERKEESLRFGVQTGDAAQGVWRLPRRHKALGSMPSTTETRCG